MVRLRVFVVMTRLGVIVAMVPLVSHCCNDTTLIFAMNRLGVIVEMSRLVVHGPSCLGVR